MVGFGIGLILTMLSYLAMYVSSEPISNSFMIFFYVSFISMFIFPLHFIIIPQNHGETKEEDSFGRELIKSMFYLILVGYLISIFNLIINGPIIIPNIPYYVIVIVLIIIMLGIAGLIIGLITKK